MGSYMKSTDGRTYIIKFAELTLINSYFHIGNTFINERNDDFYQLSLNFQVHRKSPFVLVGDFNAVYHRSASTSKNNYKINLKK